MKLRITNYELQILKAVLIIAFLLITHNSTLINAASAAEWGGVDESVVEKYAEEHGREARDPFINTDQGDLLLFVFLLAGAVGGFAAGYYWRELTEKTDKKDVQCSSK
jgi:ABC-type cobalt transport system substrate-binding protein